MSKHEYVEKWDRVSLSIPNTSTGVNSASNLVKESSSLVASDLVKNIPKRGDFVAVKLEGLKKSRKVSPVNIFMAEVLDVDGDQVEMKYIMWMWKTAIQVASGRGS